MNGTRFNAGQIVRFVPGTHERAYGGLYQIVGKLPEERGESQYRVKSTNDNHERIVRESQINPAAEAPAKIPARAKRGKNGKPATVRLSAAERFSLRRLVAGTPLVAIPVGHLLRFRQYGLMANTAAGEVLTKKGKAEAAKTPRRVGA